MSRLPLVLGLLALTGALWAADPEPQLSVKITPQVVERDHSVSWEQPLSKVVTPGNPVVVNIDAATLAVRITVTPFARGSDYLLVVQGDIRQTSPGSVRRSTHLSSLLAPANQPVDYFPLGPADESGRQMVVRIVVGPSE